MKKDSDDPLNRGLLAAILSGWLFCLLEAYLISRFCGMRIPFPLAVGMGCFAGFLSAFMAFFVVHINKLTHAILTAMGLCSVMAILYISTEGCHEWNCLPFIIHIFVYGMIAALAANVAARRE